MFLDPDQNAIFYTKPWAMVTARTSAPDACERSCDVSSNLSASTTWSSSRGWWRAPRWPAWWRLRRSAARTSRSDTRWAAPVSEKAWLSLKNSPYTNSHCWPNRTLRAHLETLRRGKESTRAKTRSGFVGSSLPCNSTRQCASSWGYTGARDTTSRYESTLSSAFCHETKLQTIDRI